MSELDQPFTREPTTIQEWLRLLIKEIDESIEDRKMIRKENLKFMSELKEDLLKIIDRVKILEDSALTAQAIAEAFEKREQKDADKREEDKRQLEVMILQEQSDRGKFQWAVGIAATVILGLLGILLAR